jgi:WD40 repeat protein
MTWVGGKRRAAVLAGLMFLLSFSPSLAAPGIEPYDPEPLPPGTAHLAMEVPASPEDVKQTPEIFVQMGHISGSFNYTNALAFLHRGESMLSGNGDGTVKLWQTQTGREEKTLRCRDDVTHLDVSQGEDYVVTGDQNHEKNVNLWELSSGRLIRSFDSPHSQNGHPVLFCNNGTAILAGGGEGTLTLLDIPSGRSIRTFNVRSNASTKPDVSSMVLTPDGKSVIAGYRTNAIENVNGVNRAVTSKDHSIRIWNLATGKMTASFNTKNGWISALAVTPDGTALLSCDWQQDRVILWNIRTGKQTRTFPGYTSAIDVSAGGRYALLGGCMEFRLVELSTGKVVRKIGQDIAGWVRAIRFSPDGRSALVGDDTSKPKLWNLETGVLAATFGGYANQLESVSLSRTGHVLLTASDYDDRISLWDYRNGRLIKTLDRDPDSIMSAATISSDGTFLATGGWNTRSRTSNAIIWEAATSKPVARMELDVKSGSHTQFLHITDGNRFLIWATPEYLIISDLQTGKAMKKIPAEALNLEEIQIDPNGQYILAPSRRKGASLFSIPGGALLKTIGSGEEAVYIAGRKDIREFATFRNENGERERLLTVYDAATLAQTSRVKTADTFYGRGIGDLRDRVYFYHDSASGIDTFDGALNRVVSTLSGHTGGITCMDLSPDGAFVCSGSKDGTTRFWNTETGREAARFISFNNGEWVVITPEGYFNASANGAKYINVRVGARVYSIDNFYERYFNPVHVASVLQGKNVETENDIRAGVALPPEVTIVSPETHAEFADDTVEIRISARDMGGGIDEIRLYHNGKAIGTDTRGLKVLPPTGGSVTSYTVTLVEGDNTFRAVGFSRDRTESNPSEITVKRLAPEKKTALHVLAVGINTYKNPALNLNYAEPDARGVADFFRKNGRDLFKNVDVTDIYNEKATKASFLSSLNALKDTEPQDAVVIYLAGHGENINEKWYFIPHELTFPEREEDVRSFAVSSDELSESIKNINARKVLVMIDACKSGAALLAFRGFEDRKALSQLSRATGVHVVAASSKDQFAAEVKALGHGVFTYTLLEGLNGRAAGGGETVSVRKLMSYIEEHLPEVTQKYRQEAQYPVVDSRGMDFPLAKGK